MQAEIDSTTKLDALIPGTLERIRRRYESRDTLSGLPTGFHDLDAMTWGLQPGTLTIIGARPSMGKTAFALNIVRHVALKCNLPVFIVSNDDSKERVTERLLIMGARVDGNRLRTGNLHPNDWAVLDAEAEKLKQAPIVINDRALTIPQIHEKCKTMIESGLDLQFLLIDYIQLIGFDDVPLSTENNLSVARRLKRMASDLNIPVVALSQVARAVEYRKNKRPMLSDLRGNAVDGDAADLVMFVYRDEYYNPETEQRGDAEIIIAKQRFGPVGTMEFTFLGSIGAFENKVHNEWVEVEDKDAEQENYGDVPVDISENSGMTAADIIKGEGHRVAGFMSALGLEAGDIQFSEKDNSRSLTIRFLNTLLKRTVRDNECQQILFEACECLKQDHPDLTKEALDNRIRTYQKSVEDEQNGARRGC